MNESDDSLSYDISSEDIDIMYENIDIESLDEEAVITDDYLSADTGTQDETSIAVTDDSIATDVSSQDMIQSSEMTGDDATVDEIPGEAVLTSTGTINTFSGAKLLKEQTRAKNKEILLEIIDNTNIDEEQKTEAIAKMIALTNISEKETAAEILLDAKGFCDAVVSISDSSVDVFVYASELTDAQRAQIEDIVKRKTGVAAESIIITAVDA